MMTIRTTTRLFLTGAAMAALLGTALAPARAQIGGVGSAGVPGAGAASPNTSGAGTGLSRPNAGGGGVQPLTGNAVGGSGPVGAGIAAPGAVGPGAGLTATPGLGATQPVTGVPSATVPPILVPRGRPH